jgi:glycerol-3-phosphate dehydrogenase
LFSWSSGSCGSTALPTVRYIQDKNDYEKDRTPVEEFARRAKLLLPGIEAADLVPAFSGIRPKLISPSELSPAHAHSKAAPDFIIQRDPEFPCVIQLMGIESPGLTSAPAIAEHVSGLASEVLA